MSGGMSSIRTGTPLYCEAPASCRRANARSASLSAAQIHVTLAPAATASRPDVTPAIMPPPPRCPTSEPPVPNWYETGPRLDATRTRCFIKIAANDPGLHAQSKRRSLPP